MVNALSLELLLRGLAGRNSMRPQGRRDKGRCDRGEGEISSKPGPKKGSGKSLFFNQGASGTKRTQVGPKNETLLRWMK
jgi:hypothetical protein